MSLEALLLAHAASTCAMTGLIWFVQLVHYPLLARGGGPRFRELALEHQRRTTWVVVPVMLAEAVTAGALLVAGGLRSPVMPWAGAALLALIWLSTAVLQVPQHRRLALGFDETAARGLVRGNWLRTAAWSARAALALALLASELGP